jgi:hypothetical protein
MTSVGTDYAVVTHPGLPQHMEGNVLTLALQFVSIANVVRFIMSIFVSRHLLI